MTTLTTPAPRPRPAPVVTELLKLRRSQPLLVVLGLPLVIAGTGVVNTLFTGRPLEQGWETLWVRTVGLHGLFPMPLGVAILASLVWRPEHRDGNWNALMTGRVGAYRVAGAKATAVAALVAGMQVMLLVTVLLLGKALFGLPGLPPPRLIGTAVLVAVACIPLAALQSGLSMALRSFAAPVAVGAVLAGVAVVLLTARVGVAAYALPHALATRTALLGSGMFGDSRDPGVVTYAATALAAVALAVLVVMATGHLLGRRDVRT